jgi:hypothetical protein
MRKHHIPVSLILMILFIGTSAFAQEKIKAEGKATGVFTKYHVFEIGDVEGHTFSMYEAKGAGTVATGGFSFVNIGRSDLVKGKGTQNGVNTMTDENGDVRYVKWEGEVTPIKTPSGKATLSFSGTWTHSGGSGKWENAKGSGTYKGMFVGDGIYVWSYEGELLMEK